MNHKVFSIIVIFSLILVIPTANSQLTIGSELKQELIEVKINDKGEVDVKHIVKASDMPGTVNLFLGEISHLVVTNEAGEEIESGIAHDSAGNKSIFVLPSKENSIIKYNLKNIILKDNLFTTQIKYNEKFSILFDESIEMVFVNSSVIFFEDKKGLSINGGGYVTIEFYSNESKIIEEVVWEENKFDVEIITNSNINKFNFDQESKSINFETNQKNKFITITMPEELLGGPYVTLLNDEKILHTKNIRDDSNISLNLKPETTGQITIIGTTVIPEFSMFIPLIMGFLIILTVPFVKKINLH
jgi:hypothetical protein